jgi:hypothetical protein
MPDPKFTDAQLSGMTINERLSAFALLPQWDRAALNRDRAAMISILQKVSLTEEEAAKTADTILANPKKYGF